MPEPVENEEHEIIPIAQFAARVHLKPKAIYKRIRLGQMPPGTVVQRLGHYAIDYTVFKRSIIKVN
jgi:hypothetical protein